jgi:2-succinyl-6-hydroxy-2,4-cyclohexadiene-1-carboxylate synthase
MPRVSLDGVSYTYCQSGIGEPLVFLHGFTGSGAAWWLVRDELAAHSQTTMIDLIGHGGSSAPADARCYDFDCVVDDLARVATRIGVGPATWLGYSMGGRLALGLALRHPSLVSALILESASPGLPDDNARLHRQSLDAELALQIERDGVSKFIAAWEALPLWQSQSRLSPAIQAKQREIRSRNSATGLANALRGLGPGSQPSFWSRLGEVQVPVLLLAGELDAKYAEIATTMAVDLPAASVVLAPNSGHAVHLEAPSFFAAHVRNFMADNRSRVLRETRE